MACVSGHQDPSPLQFHFTNCVLNIRALKDKIRALKDKCIGKHVFYLRLLCCSMEKFTHIMFSEIYVIGDELIAINRKKIQDPGSYLQILKWKIS